MERYEAPPSYDMTVESDMEFRTVVASVFSQQNHAMAASIEPKSDFLLLNEIRRLTPPPGAGGGAVGVISPPAPANAVSKGSPSERISKLLGCLTFKSLSKPVMDHFMWKGMEKLSWYGICTLESMPTMRICT